MAKKYVKVITSKDKSMLKNFRDVGYLSDDHVKKLGYGQKRMSKFIKDGYMEKVAFMDSAKNMKDAYRLTDKGKKYCKKSLGLKNFYKSSSAFHDTALADQYVLLSEDQRDSWLTEADLREQYELDETMSPPDGGYNTNGSMVAIEVVTSSYTNIDIEAKIGFCNRYGFEYTQTRI